MIVIITLTFFFTLSSAIRKVGPETRDFSWDPRPGTQQVGQETRELGPISQVGHGTLKVGTKTRDPGS